jgi:hypothetical protein
MHLSTTLFANTENRANEGAAVTQQAAQRIRQEFAACRVRFKWFGTTKTLSNEQKHQAAESSGADGDCLSAGKKLIDTRHVAYRALTAVRSQIGAFWKNVSLPFPEPGVRLIRRSELEGFDQRMGDLRQQLNEAVWRLNEHYGEIRAAARERLGSLYDSNDYPPTLSDLFEVNWDFPSIEPPDYLLRLNPKLFEAESRRMRERFEQAVALAEQAFLEELDRLVNHLAERLSGQDDGKPKIFRDSAIDNMQDFFERFRHLSVHSNEQLDELIERCQHVMRGVEPQGLRDNATLRREVATQLSSVQCQLDQLLVDRPRRNILRRSSHVNG